VKLLCQIGQFIIAAIVITLLIPNTFTVIRGGLALVFAASPEPSRQIGYFLGALLLELLLILILKWIVLRRPTTPQA
jgi:hypothetical protein